MASMRKGVRKVRCPNCKTDLLEPPPPTPIFKCPICLILLRAKGIPADYVARRTDVPQTSTQHAEQGLDKTVAYKGSVSKQHIDVDNMGNSLSNRKSPKLSDYELSFKYLKERCLLEESSDQHAAHARSTSRTEASILQCDASEKTVKLKRTIFTCDAFEPEFDFPVPASESTHGPTSENTHGGHPFTSSKIEFFSSDENGYKNDNAALSESKTTEQPAPTSDNMEGEHLSVSLSPSKFFSPDENGCDNDIGAQSNSQAIEPPALTVDNMQGGDPLAWHSEIGLFSPDENGCDSAGAPRSEGQTSEQPAPTLDNTQGGHSFDSFSHIGFFSPDDNGCDNDSAEQFNSQTTEQPVPTWDNTQGEQGKLCNGDSAAPTEQPEPILDDTGHPLMSLSQIGVSVDQNGYKHYIAAVSDSHSEEVNANEKTSDSLSRMDLDLDINGEDEATVSQGIEDINSASIVDDNIASHLRTLSHQIITDDDQETNTPYTVIQTGKEGNVNFEVSSDVRISEQQAESLPMDDEKPCLVEAGKAGANVTHSVFKDDVEVEQCCTVKGKYPVFKDPSNSEMQRESLAANIGKLLHASDTEQLEISNAFPKRVEELEPAHSSHSVNILKIRKSCSVRDASEAFEAQGQDQLKDSKAFSARLEEVEPAHSSQSVKALKIGKSHSLKDASEVFEAQEQAHLKKGSNSSAVSDFTKMDRLRADQESRSNNDSKHGNFPTDRPQCKQATGNGRDYDMAGLDKNRKGQNTRPVQTIRLGSLEHPAFENGNCNSFSRDSRTQAKVHVDQSSGCSHECSRDCSHKCCNCYHRMPSHLNHDMKDHLFNQCACHACPSVCSICTYHSHIMPIHGCCGACSMQPSSITTHRCGRFVYSLCPHNMQMHSCSNFVAGCCPSGLSDAQQAEVDKRSTILRKQYPCLPPRHTAHYVPCQHCKQMLQVPSSLPVNSGDIQKLLCGSCRKLSSFSVNNQTGHDRYAQSSSLSYVTVTTVGTSVNSSPHPNLPSDLRLESLDRRQPSRLEEERFYSDSNGNTGTRVVKQVKKQGNNILEKDQLHLLESDNSTEVRTTLSRMSAGHDSLEQKGACSINHTYPCEESESSWSPTLDSPLYDKHTYDTSSDFDDSVYVKYQHDSKRLGQNANRGAKVFSGLLKKKLKDFGGGQRSHHHPKVVVNGLWVPDDVVKKAEERAGPINPGSYWYDCEAGFWGAMGGPCLGIIPPFIEELSFPVFKDCSAGTTKVLVNGRELHEKDLQVLASRGLSTIAGRAYRIDINGRVIDEISGRHIQNLGKLAPTIEKKGRGHGMQQPGGSSTVPRRIQPSVS